LFLDEFAEFPRNALEVLRQPLEDGHVEVSRAAAAHDFPSRFMLVAAMNPCPCGYYNDETHTCRCSHREIAKYQGRVSGPLLDRIDIQVEVAAVSMKDLAKMESGEPSANIRARVVKAREIQLERYRDLGSELTNSAVKSRDLQRTCKITPKARDTLQGVLERLKLSARAYDKILRVARTISDLAGEEEIREEDIIGASSYRRMDETIDSFWF
jgi:magnesium chelatase family protein